ncbi:hypothetical protein PspLS_01749 [Pyricularia sp. CBS 133598]|nr:hypothetical protein PspLS_01749 [Pyricularia sp. CBS 133598]
MAKIGKSIEEPIAQKLYGPLTISVQLTRPLKPSESPSPASAPVTSTETPAEDAPSQALSICTLRVLVQAHKIETLYTLPQAIAGYELGGYCGRHSCVDQRQVCHENGRKS